jgi:hypothetical protein
MTNEKRIQRVSKFISNSKYSVIPANEVVKESIVSAMFSEHLRFNSESNSDQLKNKSHDRPFLHKLERRDSDLQSGNMLKVWGPTSVGVTEKSYPTSFAWTK